jgi:hypothetical protein
MAIPYEPEDPNENFPSVRTELVEALESSFPDKCPDIGTCEREIWASVGRAQVVRFLKEMSNRAPTMRKF